MTTFTKYVLTFLVSMVPLIELRGGVPIGTVTFKLPAYWVLPLCMIGNMLPVPVIFFFARKVLVWGSDKKYTARFFTWCLEKGKHGGEKLREKAGSKGMFLALMLFVGIPLPGTGAWTGTLAASMLDLDFKKSVIAVMCGVLLAGLIITIPSVLGAHLLT